MNSISKKVNLTLVIGVFFMTQQISALENKHEKLPAKQIITNFIKDIRSGRALDKVSLYMADTVLAHQVMAEGGHTVERTPRQYREHIEEFIEAFGPFEVAIEEIISNEDKVFVRWKQVGFHNVSLEGEQPTGKRLTEITSTVYRVDNGKIVEYWLQTDRQGMSNQLK